MSAALNACTNGGVKRSGATNRISHAPALTSTIRSRRSDGLNVELMRQARTPRARSPSTWSFIKASSGETTTPTPPRWSAGSW
jgi:hypothetical protein